MQRLYIYSPQSEAYSERLNSMLCSQLLHFVFLSFPLAPNSRDIVSSNGMVDNIEEVDNEELRNSDYCMTAVGVVPPLHVSLEFIRIRSEDFSRTFLWHLACETIKLGS